MKKILFVLTFCFLALTANAQELTFDETIKYIEDHLPNYDTHVSYFYEGQTTFETGYIKHITINQTGDVKITSGNIPFNERNGTVKFNLLKLVKDKGISISENRLLFYLTSTSGVRISLKYSDDTKKISKAFLHLRSLCTEEKDPFKN